jgi:hypothetical protein
MATIGPVNLEIVREVANAHITVTYSLTGSAFDIASGQPYTEHCQLVGDDTGINPPEDNTDDSIFPSGLLTPFLSTVVFPNNAPIHRQRTKTIPIADLDEDVNGTDEIRAVVRLTPVLPSMVTRESNQVHSPFPTS